MTAAYEPDAVELADDSYAVMIGPDTFTPDEAEQYAFRIIGVAQDVRQLNASDASPLREARRAADNSLGISDDVARAVEGHARKTGGLMVGDRIAVGDIIIEIVPGPLPTGIRLKIVNDEH